VPEGDAALRYLALHDAAVAWARANRRLIAEAAVRARRSEAVLVCDVVPNSVQRQGSLWLHRKGAAEADRGLAPLAGSRESLSFLLSVPGRGRRRPSARSRTGRGGATTAP
jgi:release factor H-coupled RctB family protein